MILTEFIDISYGIPVENFDDQFEGFETTASKSLNVSFEQL